MTTCGTTCFLAELVGTAILILLGNGVVANVKLEKSGMKDGGTVQITIAWGLAVLLPAFIFGETTGAHFNPVLTIAFAADGSLAPGLVGWYVAGQMLGGMLGAFLAWALYCKHFAATTDGEAKRACFCTTPSIPCIPFNFLAEALGTFVLVFAIKGIAQVPEIAGGLKYLFVFAIIVSIGMSLGGLTGYAINPARDLGPRLVYALLPMANKASANWRYAWVPVVGPLVGALAAVWLYKVFPWPTGI